MSWTLSYTISSFNNHVKSYRFLFDIKVCPTFIQIISVDYYLIALRCVECIVTGNEKSFQPKCDPLHSPYYWHPPKKKNWKRKVQTAENKSNNPTRSDLHVNNNFPQLINFPFIACLSLFIWDLLCHHVWKSHVGLVNHRKVLLFVYFWHTSTNFAVPTSWSSFTVSYPTSHKFLHLISTGNSSKVANTPRTRASMEKLWLSQAPTAALASKQRLT